MSLMRATKPVHLILQDLITVTIEVYHTIYSPVQL